jgi:hypothetical protein
LLTLTHARTPPLKNGGCAGTVTTFVSVIRFCSREG